MESIDKELLNEITDVHEYEGAYNIRKNGQGIAKNVTENVNIVAKENNTGIEVYVKENTKFESVHIPVIITQSGLKDVVYNDFYIGKNANVYIIAGCGIHNDNCDDSEHNGIHRFFLEEGAKVKYVEKHYGEGQGTGKRFLNPMTQIEMEKGSIFEMETVQIKGVDSTERITKANLMDDTNLVISEKILTHDRQYAKTVFEVNLNGENASTKVTSRAVATEDSEQIFESKVIGNSKSFGHVECDAIIKDNAKVVAIPQVIANNVDANLIHEAAIGKIAGEQLIKLMTLGLSEKEAEQEIINGFLK